MTLLVIDGSNAVHRAHYAVPAMSHNGTPTNAIIGFMRIVKANLRSTKATRCAIVFDRPGETFRHRLYPFYKSTRSKHPEVVASIKKQIPIIVDLCCACGLFVIGKKNIEGDDILGQIAKDYASRGKPVSLLSGDKDFGQLLTDDLITLINPNKKISVTRKNIRDHFGVAADQVVDYLMLEGDAIDAIPGVYGVGPKTAIDLLSRYRHVEEIPFSAFPKPTKERSSEDQLREQFKLTRKLLTLQTNLVKYKRSDLRIEGKDSEWLAEICNQYGLKRLYGELASL